MGRLLMVRGVTWRSALLVVSFVLSFPSAVDAQASSAVVLPWIVAGADETAANDAATLSTTLTSSGLVVMSAADARRTFEHRGSVESEVVSASEVASWLTHSREAMSALADADYATARLALAETEQLSERATAELNREEARARQVLDTCLLGVRAAVETSDPRAGDRARDCRRLVPHVEPSPHIHTPEVVELLGRVDQRAAASGSGALTIESNPAGCLARLNGVPVGMTPVAVAGLVAGDYRVQVECGEGQHGRLHPIEVGATPAMIRIDAHLDETVRTQPALSLAYPTESAADLRAHDAVLVASALGVSEVWLVGRESGSLVADRIDVESGRLIASAQLTTDIRASVDALLHHPVPVHESTGALAAPAEPRNDESISPAGPVVLGVGGAVLIAGLIAGGLSLSQDAAFRSACGSDLTACAPSLRSQYDEMRTTSAVADGLVVAGGVTAALGLVLTLVLRDHAPASDPPVSATCTGTGCFVTLRGSM